MSAPLGGILGYFGAKREMAPQIVSHFGKHDMYYEPFAGSLSVLFAKEECRNEVVSEKNPDVSNLIWCLADRQAAEELYQRSTDCVVAETVFDEAAFRIEQSWPPPFRPTFMEKVLRAHSFLVVSWMGPSGLAGTTRKPRYAIRNTASGGSLAARWRAVAPSIPEWHERLKNVEFRCRDAFELIGSIPDREGVVAYIDSPYHAESRTPGRYTFDFEDADHVRLAESLGRFRKSKVVVSHYSGPIINELYRNWKCVSLSAPRKMKHVTGGEQEHTPAAEVLFINRD